MALLERVPTMGIEVNPNQGESPFATKGQLITDRLTAAITGFTPPFGPASMTDHFTRARDTLIEALDALPHASDEGDVHTKNVLLATVAFGPLALPRQLLFPTPEERITSAMRFQSASLQQEMALAIMTAKSGDQGTAFSKMIHQILLAQRAFGASDEERNLRNWWAGVRNEVGLIQALQGIDDTRVYVLNPTIASHAGRSNTAIRGDVAFGMDVITINTASGTILIVNAKGTDTPEWESIIGDTKRVAIVDATTDSLVQDILAEAAQLPAREGISSSASERKILALKIYLPPTGEDFWIPNDPNAVDTETFIAQWGRMTPEKERLLREAVTDFMSSEADLPAEHYPDRRGRN